MFYVSCHMFLGVRSRKMAMTARGRHVTKGLVLLEIGLTILLRIGVLLLKIRSCTEHQYQTAALCVWRASEKQCYLLHSHVQTQVKQECCPSHKVTNSQLVMIGAALLVTSLASLWVRFTKMSNHRIILTS